MVHEFSVLAVETGYKLEHHITILDHVGRELALASLEAAVGKVLEAEAIAEVAGSLLGIAHPELDVIEAIEGAILVELGVHVVLL